MSADRAKIPDFEERIRNLTLKAPIRPSRRSMLKRSPKSTKKLGEGAYGSVFKYQNKNNNK